MVRRTARAAVSFFGIASFLCWSIWVQWRSRLAYVDLSFCSALPFCPRNPLWPWLH